jgi:hypothetical protein
VNYIFHKLSGNTKHVQFRLHMSLWWSLVQNEYWVHFSCILWGAPTCSHVNKTAQKLKGRVLRKKFKLPIESWFLTFFHLFFSHSSAWCHLQCDRYNLSVKFLIFSKKFTRSTMLKFWVMTCFNKKNFSSLIFTNMELRFEPGVLNLIWNWREKNPRKRKDHLILIDFGVKKFTARNTPNKKTLMFECYNLLDEELEFFEVDFQQDNFKILWLLPWILILLFLRNWFFQLRQKL